MQTYENRSKSSKPQPEGIDEIRQLYRVSFSINQGIAMHFSRITKECDILVLQKLLRRTYDHIIVSKIMTAQVGFEFSHQEPVGFKYGE